VTGTPSADDVRSAEFSLARKGGYRPDDVDELLERLVAAMEAGEPIGDLVASARLATGRVGYDRAGVDALLERLAPGRRQPEAAPPVSEGRRLFGFLRRG
jgi:DivIVA domain-containing protein